MCAGAIPPFPGAFSFPATRWDPARDLVWSGFAEPGAVVAYSLSSGARVARVATGSGQNYCELTPDGSALLVAARSANRFVLLAADPERAELGAELAAWDDEPGSEPCDVTLHPNGAYAYAPDRGNGSVVALALPALDPLSRTPMAAAGGAAPVPYMATASPAGDTLLVELATAPGWPDGGEAIFDLADPAHPVEVARLGPGDGLGRVPLTSEISPDGRYGMVVCRDSSEVSVIDLEARRVAASVALPDGSNPVTGTFAAGPGADTFFVPLPGRDAVAAITVPGFRLAKLIPVGQRPVGIVALRAAVPDRAGSREPLGVALASGRAFPPGCPDPCCGEV